MTTLGSEAQAGFPKSYGIPYSPFNVYKDQFVSDAKLCLKPLEIKPGRIRRHIHQRLGSSTPDNPVSSRPHSRSPVEARTDKQYPFGKEDCWCEI